MTSERVRRTYLALVLLQTLAASLIWGVNTLFLLDAGLSLTEAFIANAAFSAGMVIFEVPTGVIADTFGRRFSYMLGAGTLLVTTLAYLGLWYVGAGIMWWILVSALIGLGFTFFSGATEAWLVDALAATGFQGRVEQVFGQAQSTAGVATLIGTITGGFMGQISLGIPYLVRSALLLLVIVAAWLWMRDIGFEPAPRARIGAQVRQILRDSVTFGLRNRPVRMFILAAPFMSGVSIWAFYAYQPYLLELFGDPNATYLSGLAAALLSLAQIVGGASVAWVGRRSVARTTIVILQIAITSAFLAAVGLAALLAPPSGFWVAIALLTGIALVGAIGNPVQQALVNGWIPSSQRATVLSFQSLTGSAGGVVVQPVLGRVADVFSLGLAYVVGGIVYLISLPFVAAVRRMELPADGPIRTEPGG